MRSAEARLTLNRTLQFIPLTLTKTICYSRLPRSPAAQRVALTVCCRLC